MADHAIPGSSLSIEPKHAEKTHKIWDFKSNYGSVKDIILHVAVHICKHGKINCKLAENLLIFFTYFWDKLKRQGMPQMC